MRNKRGSYIVEAAIVLPFFIILFVMLIWFIPMIRTAEEATFIMSDEMALESLESNFIKDPFTAPILAEKRILSYKGGFDTFIISPAGYMYTEGKLDKLISLKYFGIFNGNNDLLNINSVKFKGKITCRAFVGDERKGGGGGKELFNKNEQYEEVYIFPENGECYHKKNCKYLKSAYESHFLSGKIKKHYKPCKICNSKNAVYGQMIFYFPDGKSYHLPNCKAVDKYYIKIDKKDAEKRGYRPCSYCY